jgi:transcriptional regulator with XRE-family HTH domain
MEVRRMDIAERLKRYIEVTGRKQSAVAESVGMPTKTFNAVLNGRAALKAETLMKALDFMGVSADYFFTFEFPETRKEVS